MKKTYLGTTLDNQAIEVTVEGTKISAIKPTATQKDLPLLAPPLVDLQHNGSVGKSFGDSHLDADILPAVARHVRRHGVGRLLITYCTDPFEKHLKSLAATHLALEANADLARLYAGIFFEGNYMSREYGWRGAHNPDHMRLPSWDEWSRLQGAAGGRIKKINVDPSLPGAFQAIGQAVKNNIRITLGHCGPDAATIRKAADAGADLVTHLGNGAPPTIHRHKNPFWTYLADPRFKIGLIADGHHLPGDFLTTCIAAKGRDKVFLISDAVSTGGLQPGVYGDTEVDSGGFTHLTGQREILAGAWHQADRCVERMCELGWTLAEAWRQTSEIPARIMGIPFPKIAVGEPAEFVLSRWTADGLRLEQVVALGEELLTESIHPRMV